MGFGVWGLGFGVWGLGFRYWSPACLAAQEVRSLAIPSVELAFWLFFGSLAFVGLLSDGGFRVLGFRVSGGYLRKLREA